MKVVQVKGSYMRIRVQIDVCEVLKRGMRVLLEKDDIFVIVRFQYEWLPNFCFYCGIIDHGNGSVGKLWKVLLITNFIMTLGSV